MDLTMDERMKIDSLHFNKALQCILLNQYDIMLSLSELKISSIRRERSYESMKLTRMMCEECFEFSKREERKSQAKKPDSTN